MDESAIRAISSLAVDAQKANRLDTFTPAILHDGEASSIEHLQAGRSRFRGVFSTTLLADFVAYANANVAQAVFVDPEKFSADAFMNIGSVNEPGHADWRASITLKPTAIYAAVKALTSTPQSQRQIAEWIEDWAPFVTCFRDETAISLKDGVTAFRDLTITATSESNHVDRDFGATRSALEEIEAKARGGIPTIVEVRGEPFAGFAIRAFRLRVSVITGGDKPKLMLRIVGLEEHLDLMAREFATKIREGITGKAVVSIGSFKA